MSDIRSTVLDKLDSSASPDASRIAAALRGATTAGGTMAAWFTQRHGLRVDTVQVDRNNGSLWAPLARMVDSRTRKGSVKLDGSTRDYRGMKVISVSDDALIVSDDWHWIAYVAREES